MEFRFAEVPSAVQIGELVHRSNATSGTIYKIVLQTGRASAPQ